MKLKDVLDLLLLSALWGAIFINERLTTNMVIGCTIILTGTALATGMLSFNRKSELYQDDS